MHRLESRESSRSRTRGATLRALNTYPLRSSSDMMWQGAIGYHDAIHQGRVAVVTGAADGIGLAAARHFASIGMKLAIADINEAKLDKVKQELVKALGEQNVISVVTDVSKIDDVKKLSNTVFDQWGEVAVLMNNAGISVPSGSFNGVESWHKIMDTNLFGILNVQHTFVPQMIWQENQCLIINTGSKQGITNPPGNPAYNASKAAVKSLTESLAHELLQNTQTRLTAHLFVPGWTHTGLSQSPTKPDGAWTADETVNYLVRRLVAGHFYIVCPDNEVSNEVDNLRIMWSAADIVEGRPALSRWHPDFKAEFNEFMHDGLAEMQMLHSASRSRPGSVMGDPPSTDHDNL